MVSFYLAWHSVTIANTVLSVTLNQVKRQIQILSKSMLIQYPHATVIILPGMVSTTDRGRNLLSSLIIR